jgi:hypothetical protein
LRAVGSAANPAPASSSPTSATARTWRSRKAIGETRTGRRRLSLAKAAHGTTTVREGRVLGAASGCCSRVRLAIAPRQARPSFNCQNEAKWKSATISMQGCDSPEAS